METSQLQKRIDAISWYHEFDFGNGLRACSQAPDVETHRKFWRFIEEGLNTIELKDKTVLDVGCWDGYWSFYAERRGAKSVLAVDDFSQNWSNEAGLLLAKELLGSGVQTETRVSVYDLQSLNQKFDVILFLGVYYHLVDPFYAFAQLRHCCHSETVICLEGNESIGLPENTAKLDSAEHSGRFFPTAGFLNQLLRAAYFSVSTGRYLEPPPSPPARVTRKWRRRMFRQALFGPSSTIRQMAAEITGPEPWHSKIMRRAFLTCRPFEGENPVYYYRPPFGLHAFDPRFKG
jgi:tRNA (mo5U34)-methyltransferase